MADAKITGLAELTTPASGDLFGIVDDPAGTPITKKITIDNLDLNLMDNSSSGFYSSGDTPSFAGATITGTNGIDVNPGSDTDADLITVGVTDSPKLWWDESEDRFGLNKDLEFSGKQLHSKPSQATVTAEAYTIYVDTATGSDSDDGSNGSPVATIQQAVDMLPDLLAHNVTIDVADGTYTEQVDLDNKAFTQPGLALEIQGNTTTPGNVVVDGGSARDHCIDLDNAKVKLNGMKLQNATINNLELYQAEVTLENFETTSAGASGVFGQYCKIWLDSDVSSTSNADHGISVQFESLVAGSSYVYNDVTNFEVANNSKSGVIAQFGCEVFIKGASSDSSNSLIHDQTQGGVLCRESQTTIQYTQIGGNGSEGVKTYSNGYVFVEYCDEGTYGDNGGTNDLYAFRNSAMRVSGNTDLDTGSDATSDIIT